MKGQLFIIAAIFMIVVVVLIKNSTGTTDFLEDGRFQDTRITDKNLENLAEEFRQVAALSVFGQDPASSEAGYFRNISVQARGDFDSSILYVFVFGDGAGLGYNVLIGNYLGDRINMTLNGSGASGSMVIDDASSVSRSYVSAINGSFMLKLNYTNSREEMTEAFNVTVDSKKNFALFSDITLRETGFAKRRKDVYSWSWSG